MTCIVGLINKKTVYIGGDSSGVSGTSLIRRKDAKIFRRGKFIFGFTSSFRMGQLLMHGDLKLKDKTKKEDAYEYMIKVFIPAIRILLKDGGYLKKENGEESVGCFLVGFEGRLFEIEEDLQVGESLDNYNAIGWASDLALGSLYTTQDINMKPEDRILKALEASEYFSTTVCKPFKIIKI